MNTDFIEVETFDSRMEAKVAQGLLEVNGIKSFVSGENKGVIVVPTQDIGNVSLWVMRDDYLTAKKLLGKNKA